MELSLAIDGIYPARPCSCREQDAVAFSVAT
jgi:hypothetical protein